MTVNTDESIFTSGLSGLHNYGVTGGVISLNSQGLGSHAFVSYPAQVFPTPQSNSIANILINISTFETVWRPVFNLMRIKVNGSTSPVHWSVSGYTYFLDIIPQYSAGNVSLLVSATNATSGSIAVPALTINYKAEFFLPPY